MLHFATLFTILGLASGHHRGGGFGGFGGFGGGLSQSAITALQTLGVTCTTPTANPTVQNIFGANFGGFGFGSVCLDSTPCTQQTTNVAGTCVSNTCCSRTGAAPINPVNPLANTCANGVQAGTCFGGLGTPCQPLGAIGNTGLCQTLGNGAQGCCTNNNINPVQNPACLGQQQCQAGLAQNSPCSTANGAAAFGAQANGLCQAALGQINTFCCLPNFNNLG